ncbi:sensor histidine kinase [Undibacterium sp. Xuan67W]|uniref:sensor histidine kinase n=1 Tax=Undibacterium sp. Xuan67W TaxID=3413057 RepID=UPI003BF2693C
MTSISPNTDTERRLQDQPLPSEVSLQSDTWLTRARNYPVFSRTWYRYRSLAWFGVLGPSLVVITGIAWMLSSDMQKFLAVAIPTTLGFTALHLLGTAGAVWVRQKAYAETKEAILLISTLLLGAAVSYGMFDGTRYLAKYIPHGDSNVTISIGASSGSSSKSKNAGNKLNTASASASANSSPAASLDSKAEAEAEDKEEDPADAGVMVGKFVSFVLMASVLIYAGGGVDFWLFFRQRKRLLEALQLQELQLEQSARREAELRLSVLVAQVEPHFLFNTLAGVRSAILTEPARATAIVDHLVDYLRATIPQMRSDGSSEQARLAQQLEAVRAYLALMQARIPRLSFSVESDVSDAALPPLMLISLVENAIKHGIEPKIGPAHIAVTARSIVQQGEAMLELVVADDGVGFGGSTSGSGIGLANIHERLSAMYGKRAELVLKARPDGGVAAIIRLPLTH